MSHDRHRASILIRSKNEAAALESTLRGVLSQRVRPHEVILIDSGSTDGTLEIAAQHPVHIVHLPSAEWGYGHALNVGAAAATGDVLVCLSAHCVPVTDEWLGNLLRHFEHSGVAAVWGPGVRPGRVVPDPVPVIVQLPGSYGFDNRLWGLSNGNSAIRQSLWAEIPFEERLPAAEDKAWGWEVLTRGYEVVYDPAAAVWHAQHDLASAYRRNRAIYQGFVAMFPDERVPRTESARALARAVGRALWRNLREPNAREFASDCLRFPSTAASVLGAMLVGRGHTGSRSRLRRTWRRSPGVAADPTRPEVAGSDQPTARASSVRAERL